MSNLGFRVVDSHTAGEPTRTIVDCDLNLPASTMDERLAILRSDFDHFRRAIVREPRGSEVMVGAHLLPPIHPDHTAAVVFFNNVGYLGMCGHGMIGVIETLRFLGRIQPGIQTIETVAGIVKAELLPDHSVRIQNVPSYRIAKDAPIATQSFGTIPCDIAYGGNWFCLAKPDAMKNLDAPIPELLSLSQELMVACREQYPDVDHVELVGPPRHPTSNARNFVLCPGAMYDRSPCGTGTSAKLACLAADGELLVGQRWIQEGVLGTRFEGTFQWYDSECGKIIPTVRGRAFVNGDLQVVVDPEDPFAWGDVKVVFVTNMQSCRSWGRGRNVCLSPAWELVTGYFADRAQNKAGVSLQCDRGRVGAIAGGDDHGDWVAKHSIGRIEVYFPHVSYPCGHGIHEQL